MYCKLVSWLDSRVSSLCLKERTGASVRSGTGKENRPPSSREIHGIPWVKSGSAEEVPQGEREIKQWCDTKSRPMCPPPTRWHHPVPTPTVVATAAAEVGNI
ncbi:hypothetical protein AMECASPLE_018501 [Ameca splendens]|uniref:Uncharacterized protein n=1 Tax=Ameca splendens TaxID=208324 RepID=A0ABV0XRM3_9TELE